MKKYVWFILFLVSVRGLGGVTPLPESDAAALARALKHSSKFVAFPLGTGRTLGLPPASIFCWAALTESHPTMGPSSGYRDNLQKELIEKLGARQDLAHQIAEMRHLIAYRFSHIVKYLMESKGRVFDPKKTLIVFDFDETLIRIAKFIGGDHWYRYLRDHHVKAGKLTFEELLALQMMFFEEDTSVTAEKTTAAGYAQVSSLYKTIILTSRAPEHEPVTTMARVRNGLQKPFLDWEPPTEMHRWVSLVLQELYGANAREVGQSDDVLYANGMDKGAVLKAFLSGLDWHPYDIVVIDDDLEKLLAIQIALFGSEHRVTTIQFNPPNMKTANLLNRWKADRHLKRYLRERGN